MNSKIKHIGIVTFSVVLFFFLHLMIPPELTNETPENIFSPLILSLGFPLTALLWGGMAYSCVAYVFYLIKDKIPGKKGTRGLRYGISIGTLWLLGYIMCYPKFGNPFLNEFVGGLCDALPVVVMGWLLGKFTINKNVVAISNGFQKRQSYISIIIFVLCFFIIRSGAYYMEIIDIGFPKNPLYIMAWTIVMGLCLGIMNILLGKTVGSSFPIVSASKFGFLLFGATWGIFIMFFPLVLKGELINTLLMLLIDTIAVTIAYYFSETQLNRKF